MLDSILLASLAVLGWALFMYVLKPYARFSFVETPMRTLAYFIALTVFIACAYLPVAAALYLSTSPYALLFAAIVLFYLNPWLYRFSRAEHGAGARTTVAHPDLELLRLDDRFLISKIGDVLFQQTALGMLVLMLPEAPLLTASLLCGVLLAVAHAGLVFRMPPAWSGYFIASAFAGGLSLPWLLLSVSGGFYYAVAFHMLWYAASGVFYGKLAHQESRTPPRR